MIRRLVEDVRQAVRPPICTAGFPRSGTLTAVLRGFDLLPTGAPAGGGMRAAG